jgi:hypothetical protein
MASLPGRTAAIVRDLRRAVPLYKTVRDTNAIQVVETLYYDELDPENVEIVDDTYAGGTGLYIDPNISEDGFIDIIQTALADTEYYRWQRVYETPGGEWNGTMMVTHGYAVSSQQPTFVAFNYAYFETRTLVKPGNTQALVFTNARRGADDIFQRYAPHIDFKSEFFTVLRGTGFWTEAQNVWVTDPSRGAQLNVRDRFDILRADSPTLRQLVITRSPPGQQPFPILGVSEQGSDRWRP